GTTLFKLDGSAYTTPEFPRGGLSAYFTLQVTHVSAGPTLNVDLETRNEEDTTRTVAASFDAITAVGVAAKDVTGRKELVRLKLTVSGATAAAAVHFILPAPAWRPN
ncbi:MAG: hypothetical protein ACT4PV_15395, partial [Planctomycetaceae bacterium]